MLLVFAGFLRMLRLKQAAKTDGHTGGSTGNIFSSKTTLRLSYGRHHQIHNKCVTTMSTL